MLTRPIRSYKRIKMKLGNKNKYAEQELTRHSKTNKRFLNVQDNMKVNKVDQKKYIKNKKQKTKNKKQNKQYEILTHN